MKNIFDICLLDIMLPGKKDGMELANSIRKKNENIPIILLSSKNMDNDKIAGFESGADDYITKPFTSTDLLQVARRAFGEDGAGAVTNAGTEEARRALDQARTGKRAGFARVIGGSSAMESVFTLIEKVAPTHSNVLVYGESGTGKELVARAIHDTSLRAERPFIPVDCVSLPDTLLESELFGHEKGAFTGAHVSKPGLFEVAAGGTVFLDEVSGMSQTLQSRLLRVLQERQMRRVGGIRFLDVDVRVIAATNANLEKAIQQGRFRSDLYYRLNVFPIHMPPLRERPEDIPILARHFLRFHARRLKRLCEDFDASSMERLVQYAWPGNVRELSNLVDRFSTLFPGQTLTCQLVPSCMLPSGLVALQTQRLGREQVASWQIQQPARVEPAVVMAPLQVDPAAPAGDRPAFDPVLHAMEIASAVHSPEAQLAVPVPKPAASASNDEINAVEEAIFLAQGIQPLPPEGISLKQHLVNIERGLIEQALSRTEGNVSRTAKLLQLQRTTLIEKINKYDLRASS